MMKKKVSPVPQVDQRLAEVLELNQKIMVASPLGVIAFRASSGECVLANAAIAQMIGASPEDVTRQNFRQIDSWKNNGLLEAAERVLADGLEQHREIYMTTSFGKEVWFECHLSRFTSGGEPHLLAITHDITPRKNAEQALAASEELFRNMVEHIGIGIAVVNPELRILSLNGQLRGWFPTLNPEEQPFCHQILRPASQPTSEEEYPVRQTLHDGQVRQFITQSLRGDEWRQYRVVSTPLSGPSGQVAAAIIMVDDVTEQKRLEQALRQSEKNFKAIVENAHDAIVIVTDDTRFVYANRRAAEIIGYSLDELLQMHARDVIHPDELPMVLERYNARLNGLPVLSHYEIRIVHRDGRPIPIDVSAGLTEWSGQPADLAIIRDISERRRMTEALTWEMQVNAVLAALSRRTLQSGTPEELADLILEQAKQLTSSAFGFVGHIDPDTGYLITNTTSQDIWDNCKVVNKSTVFKEFNGLSGWVLKNRQPLLTNSPADDPRSQGVPVGHIPIDNFLSAPALVGGTLVGQIALANSSQPYTRRELELIERLADLYAIALQRYRTEDRLRRHVARLAALAEVSRSIIEAGLDYQAVLDTAARRISELMGDFCLIRLLSSDRQWLNPVALYHRDPQIMQSFDHVLYDHPQRADEGISGNVVRTGQPMRLLIADQDIIASSALQEYAPFAVRFGLRSILQTPLRTPSGVMGLIMVARTQVDAVYTPEDQSFLQDMADRVALSIAHACLYTDNLRQRDELEERVIVRTVEVSAINQRLHAELVERQRAQEAEARLVRELARSNADLEQFAYIASHDLQEPLRMVTSYLQLLERRSQDHLDSDARDFIRFARDGAHHMQRLISDLLTYSRVGTRGKEFALVDCEEVLKRVLANLQIAISESEAVILHEPLPKVIADDMQLIQLFQNLIGNALKFRSQVSPSIHISAQRMAEQDEQPAAWRFCVRDNGIGIAPQHFDRIFVIFQRLHTRDEYPGTGIGLALCKKIVERHGGQIWLESQPGQGAAFYFTIPVQSQPDLPGGAS